MKAYLWMTDFTPQREWIEGKGFLLLLAFFFTEVGAGLYVVSLFLGFRQGCLIGWLVCALLGGGLHMAYLGKPERVWRAMLRPKTSELSRGMIIIGLFLVLGALQLAPTIGPFSGLPWASNALFFKISLSILGFFVIVHGFMTLNIMSSLPFWNSSIVPVLSVASGIWVGSQLTIGLGLFLYMGEIQSVLEPVAMWSLFSYVLLTVFYLWNAGHSSLASLKSYTLLMKGELAPLFYIGVVLIALLVPTIITFYIYGTSTETSAGLLYVRVACAFIGDLTLRYCIHKAARYSPLIESNIIKGMRQHVP